MAISIFVTKAKMSYQRSLPYTKGSLTPRAIHVIYFHVVSFLLNTNEEFHSSPFIHQAKDGMKRKNFVIVVDLFRDCHPVMFYKDDNL